MKPELLLPAGDLSILKIAVDNGADAVYVGAAAFSARKGAVNFSEDELRQAVVYAHERSARVYLALNTLVADDELKDALATAVHAAACGVDAMIVQDIGLAALVHRVIPSMPLHASTQMTIYDESAFPALLDAGIRRIILPRELSLPEVACLTAAAQAQGLETELFIHGALCVCFSGQCLFSSFMGGRSGNRGACAQPCRLSYRIAEDGRSLPAAACLSPRDQAAFRHLPAILETGVGSLKIEGRMRSAAYVGQTAAVYRSLLDALPDSRTDLETINERLLLAFNRGGTFTDRAFSGKRDRSFLSGSTTGSFGLLIGTVAEVKPQAGILSIKMSPSVNTPGKGDFLSVRRLDRKNDMDPPDHQVEVASAPVGTLQTIGQQLLVRGFHPDALTRLQAGDFVYRMNDARQDQTVQAAKTRRTVIDLTLTESQQRVQITASVSEGPFTGTRAEADVMPETGMSQPLAIARTREQLAKTGGTPFQVRETHVPEPVSLTIAGLNQLRRSVLQTLSEQLAQVNQQLVPTQALSQEIARIDTALHPLSKPAGAVSKTSDRIQMAAFFYQWPTPEDPIACGADAYLMPAAGLENRSSRRQLADLRSAEPGSILVLVLPPAAAGNQASQIREWLADGTLRLFDRISGGHPGIPAMVRQLGFDFEFDSTANVYNHLSLQRSIQAGAAVTCLSPELGEAQLLQLARFAGGISLTSQTDVPKSADRLPGQSGADPLGHRLEWFVYGRQRLMYSAFCPVGHNVAGCSRCSGHQYLMTDRKDRVLPLLLHPPYCTSTILHADAISPPANLPELIENAPARLRLLFFNERQIIRQQEISLMRSRFEPNDRTKPGTMGV